MAQKYSQNKKTHVYSTSRICRLGMVDIRACNLAAKGSWIKPLLSPENSKWKNLTWSMLDINDKQLINSYSLKSCMSGKRLFHTQTLKAWAEINSFMPATLKEIINQNVYENIYLQIDNNPIKYTFLGIKNKTSLQKNEAI